MSKHTPAPWLYSLESTPHPQYNIYTLAQPFCRHICTVNALNKQFIVSFDKDTVLNNARLIAAAPEMFSALKAILFQIEQGKVLERDACIQQAKRAISKATIL